MKVYTDALALLGWLAQRESASVSEITASGLMGSREASDVIRYALRNGVVERANGEAARRGSARYRSTGVPLPEPRSRNVEASLTACCTHGESPRSLCSFACWMLGSTRSPTRRGKSESTCRQAVGSEASRVNDLLVSRCGASRTASTQYGALSRLPLLALIRSLD